eukprot:364550-Chlamydomonas_euryale.AAC.12
MGHSVWRTLGGVPCVRPPVCSICVEVRPPGVSPAARRFSRLVCLFSPPFVSFAPFTTFCAFRAYRVFRAFRACRAFWAFRRFCAQALDQYGASSPYWTLTGPSLGVARPLNSSSKVWPSTLLHSGLLLGLLLDHEGAAGQRADRNGRGHAAEHAVPGRPIRPHSQRLSHVLQ